MLLRIQRNGARMDRLIQDLRFGAGNLREAFWTVDVLQGIGGRPGYDGFVHFDYKPPRTEDLDGVWETARGCMRNYLILRDKVKAFRADPEVIEALAAARVPELSQPTLGAGETLADLRKAYDRWWQDVVPRLENEGVVGPKVNPFKERYWTQFGGGPDEVLRKLMDPANAPYYRSGRPSAGSALGRQTVARFHLYRKCRPGKPSSGHGA